MSSLSRFVGLDDHQESIQVCVLDEHGKSSHETAASHNPFGIIDAY